MPALGWSKNRMEKNRTGNFDTFLDIIFLLLELLKKMKLICKVETNI
jgi:hypothetical protein